MYAAMAALLQCKHVSIYAFGDRRGSVIDHYWSPPQSAPAPYDKHAYAIEEFILQTAAHGEYLLPKEMHDVMRSEPRVEYNGKNHVRYCYSEFINATKVAEWPLKEAHKLLKSECDQSGELETTAISTSQAVWTTRTRATLAKNANKGKDKDGSGKEKKAKAKADEQAAVVSQPRRTRPPLAGENGTLTRLCGSIALCPVLIACASASSHSNVQRPAKGHTGCCCASNDDRVRAAATSRHVGRLLAGRQTRAVGAVRHERARVLFGRNDLDSQRVLVHRRVDVLPSAKRLWL